MSQPRKRKSDSEKSEGAKQEKKKLSIGEDGLGTEDYLSRLPNLCLLELLKNLSRSDIEHMKFVNQRILPLASDHSLDKIKWSGYMKIFQKESGYGFILNMTDEDDEPIYQFDMIKSENGDFVERRRKLEDVEDHDDEASTPNNDPIPERFYSVLSDILRYRNPKLIELCQMSFNDIFFTKLGSVLDETSDCFLSCFRMGTSPITEETRKRFAKFAKRFKSVDLQMSERITSLINEEFLSEIVEFKIQDFRCNANPFDVYEHRFHPSEAILPKLIKFKYLDAAAMILNANWVPKLFMAFMDTLECKRDYSVGSWRFAVDQPITFEIISEQIKHQQIYEHSFKRREGPPDRGTMYHYIVRKSDEMSAKFNTLGMTMNGGVGTMFIIDVEFFGRRQIPKSPGFYSPLPRNRMAGPRR